MLPIRFTTALVVAVAAAPAFFGAARPAQADEPGMPPRSAKQDLTPESLAALHTLIRPHDHEWRHLRVQWLTDVAAVRKKAIAEDKPIIICYTGGAGYNEPLGVC